MFSSSNYCTTILSVAFIFTSFAAQATDSLQDLQALKKQITTNEKYIQALAQNVVSLDQQIQELADKRHFYQIFRTPEETALIATREENIKKSTASQEQVKQLRIQLRTKASEYIGQNEIDYAEMKKAVTKLTPIATQGEAAVRDLNQAYSQLSSSQVSSAINATGSVIGALTGAKPSGLNNLAELLAQQAANSALKAGQNSLNEAVAFSNQLQNLAHGNNSTILSGSWSGALERGVIFALITGRNPLMSNGFNFSNSMFQLSNLKEVKDKVKTAQEAVTPVSQSMSRELAGLNAKLTHAEDEFIRQL